MILNKIEIEKKNQTNKTQIEKKVEKTKTIKEFKQLREKNEVYNLIEHMCICLFKKIWWMIYINMLKNIDSCEEKMEENLETLAQFCLP